MSDRKTILIVDDEEDITWAISKCLSNMNFNFNIFCVNNGDKAYELLCRKSFDLVVTDIRMPGRNGLQLVLDARKIHAPIKVIIMTAYGSQEVMERADILGSYFYIEKPFDISYLKQVIFNALEIKTDGFKGQLEYAGIREVIELNCSTKSNSSLFVYKKKEKGTIYFRNGDIVHAECGQLKGESAFFNILNWGQGSFKIKHDPISTKRTISRDWKSLLYQCT